MKLDKYYVADFETIPLSQYEANPQSSLVWLWGIIQVGKNRDDIKIGTNLTDFFKYVFSLPNYAKIYFHNGGHFDFWYCLDWLLANGFQPTLSRDLRQHLKFSTLIDEKKQMYYIRIYFNNYWYELRDSFLILPLSVANLGNDEISKLEMDYQKWHLDTDIPTADEITYLQNDILIIANHFKNILPLLALAEEKTQNYIHHRVKLTLGSTSLQKLINLMGNTYYLEHLHDKLTPEQRIIIRESYGGGLCLANEKYLNKVVDETCYKYDVNSLYPSVMIEPLPIDEPLTEPPLQGLYTALIQVNIITAKLHNGFHPYINNSGIFHRVYYKEIKTATMFYFWDFEWEHIKKIYDLDYQIGEIMYFRLDSWSRGYIFSTYQKRLDYPKDSPQNFTAKILLNSSYGKFAEKNHRFDYQIISELNLMKMNKGDITYENDDSLVPEWIKYGFALVEHENENSISHRHLAVASYICARARIKLHQAITTNRDIWLYSDTDSLITRGEAKGIDIDTKRLGAWKFEGTSPKFFTRGAKHYWFDNEIIVAGLPTKISQGKPIEWLVNGGIIEGKKSIKWIKGIPFIYETTFDLTKLKSCEYGVI